MILFFWGPNSFAGRQKIRDMAGQYLKKSGSDLGFERINGVETDLSKLAASVTTAPFLSDTRLVVVENFGQNKQSADIKKILGNIPDTTVAVFFEDEVDQRTSYFKQMNKTAKVVKFDNLSQPKLEAWAKSEFDRLGSKVDQAAVSKLVGITGEDQWRLSNEIAKLANFGEVIGVKEVEEMVVESPSQTIFDLVEAMAAGQLSKALKMYHDLLDQQVNEHYILTMIIWQLRNMVFAKTAGAISPDELSKQAGLSPFVAGKVMAKRGNYSEEVLKKAFLLAIETDYQIKSGLGESVVLVERLIYKVSQNISS